MDILKYKKYVRDTNISDDDFKEIVNDVLIDITLDTKIFRTTVGFSLTNCVDEYNIKDIFNISSSVEDQVVDIKFTVDEDDSINLNSNNPGCPLIDEKVQTELVLQSSDDIFLGCIELVRVYADKTEAIKYGSRSLIENVTEKYFTKLNDNLFYSKKLFLESLYGKTYDVNILANCIYRPDPEKITEEQENIIKQAIIAGIKYNLSDMYLNTTNEQVSNILYQRYWSTKKQIRNNYPQLIGTVSDFSMDSWNI